MEKIKKCFKKSDSSRINCWKRDKREELKRSERACDVGNTGRQRKDDEENGNGSEDKARAGKKRVKGWRKWEKQRKGEGLKNVPDSQAV